MKIRNDFKFFLQRLPKIKCTNELESYVLAKIAIKELEKVIERISDDAYLIFTEDKGSAPSKVLGCNVSSYTSRTYGYSKRIQAMDEELKKLKEKERNKEIAKVLTESSRISVTVKTTLRDLLDEE